MTGSVNAIVRESHGLLTTRTVLALSSVNDSNRPSADPRREALPTYNSLTTGKMFHFSHPGQFPALKHFRDLSILLKTKNYSDSGSEQAKNVSQRMGTNTIVFLQNAQGLRII